MQFPSVDISPYGGLDREVAVRMRLRILLKRSPSPPYGSMPSLTKCSPIQAHLRGGQPRHEGCEVLLEAAWVIAAIGDLAPQNLLPDCRRVRAGQCVGCCFSTCSSSLSPFRPTDVSRGSPAIAARAGLAGCLEKICLRRPLSSLNGLGFCPRGNTARSL